ncbi:MAG: 7TM diverse intracellular signaling domain-containing protein [Ferruginibacter sp.]
MVEFNKYFLYFFEGACVFMTLFFFVQFIVLKKSEYFFYGLYLLVLSLYYLTALPDFFFKVAQNDPAEVYRYDMLKRPLQFMSSIFYSLFVMYYLRLQKNSPRLNRFLMILLFFYVLMALLCLAGNISRINYDNAYYLVSMLFFPIQLIMVISLFKTKVPYSRYVIWGTLLLLIGSTFTLWLSFYLEKKGYGKYTQTDFSYIPVQIAILADILLFSIALQRKVADNEKFLLQAAIQRQQAINLERERIITDLHDDVGGGLSSIRMMSDLMAQENAADKNRSVAFAQKISATAKDIAQRMHTIIWSLNAENDSVENFAEYVRQYGVSYFEDAAIHFACEISTEIPANALLSGIQRKNLFLVSKEAFHNILKHAGASRVQVSIKIDEGRLCLSIHDNGKGIQNSNQFGNGLKNMQKRIDEIKGTIQFSSENGTLVSVCAPLMTQKISSLP